MFASIFRRGQKTPPPSTAGSSLGKQDGVLDGRIAKPPKTPTRPSRSWWGSKDLPELSARLKENVRLTTPPAAANPLPATHMGIDSSEAALPSGALRRSIEDNDLDTDGGADSAAEQGSEDEVSLRAGGNMGESVDVEMADYSEEGGEEEDEEEEGDEEEDEEEDDEEDDVEGVDVDEEDEEETDVEGVDFEAEDDGEQVEVEGVDVEGMDDEEEDGGEDEDGEGSDEATETEVSEGDSDYQPEDGSDHLRDEDLSWGTRPDFGDEKRHSASESPDPLNIDDSTARRGRYRLLPVRQAVVPASWPAEEEEDDEEDTLPPEEGDDLEGLDNDWDVDPEELEAYEESKSKIPDTKTWLRDEHRLHKFLSLRGMHPLVPSTWKFDFLGIPIFPSLFAPSDSESKTLIEHVFRQSLATKAFTGLFDLQFRVMCLRQIGNNHRIARVINQELNRYVKWVFRDADLDKYNIAPNIVIKAVSVAGLDKDALTKMINKAFQVHLDKYAAFYSAAHPELAAPRVIYGFFAVQHAVMLFTMDAARPKVRPRLITDFNLAQKDQWLDASLCVAIPVYLARARLLQLTSKMEPMEEEEEDDPDL